jgi:predicted hydrocarbon binding protein
MDSPVPTEAAQPAAIYSSHFLREMLLSLRLVSNRDYAEILAAAGLGRYADSLPDPTQTLIATPADIAQLFSADYTRLAAPQSRLFFTNMGEHLARETWADPAVQALVPAIQAVPAADQISTAWRELIAIVNRQARIPREVSSDDRNDYLTIYDCPYCQAISRASEPVCFATVRFYEVLLKHLTGQPVIVREVKCRALGHDSCQYAVRRPAPPPRPR